MATTKSKKSTGKKKTEKQDTKKHPIPDFLTPYGIAIPCMPLQAFVDMIFEDYRNPFYTGMDYYTEKRKSDYEYDVFKGWLISKKRCESSRKFEIEWIMKLPDNYSVAHFVDYFDGETDIPRGKWIGPTSVINIMHANHRVACDRISDLIHKGFNTPYAISDEVDSLPKEISFDDFESEDLDEVWFREFTRSGNS